MKIQQNPVSCFSSLFILILGASLLTDISMAQQNGPVHVSSDVDSEVVARFSESNAVRIITSRDRSVNLVVADVGIAVQFTDRFLDDLEDEIHESEKNVDESSTVANVITSMVGSGVRTLLDHSILIPFHEISGITLDDGRIVIIDANGKEIFEDLEINDKQVMEDFSRRDARRFVADAEQRLI